MNIKKIKDNLESKVGQTLKFRFNGSRNQIEEFKGKIESIYNYVFLIKIDNEQEQIRSFSYTDVLTEHLEIFIDN